MAGSVSALALLAGAAEAGDLRGAVRDANTGGLLQGVNLRIAENGRTAVTGRDGSYSLLALPAGRYTVTAEFVGYQPVQQTIEVAETGVAELAFSVGEGSPGEVAEIVVTGARAAQAEALQVKRSATVILDALSADDVGKLPDNNAADALQRLPGVTVTIDQGEGRYVIVRGIDSNLVNVTVNGQIFPGPEGGSRRVALDTFPADVIERLEVIKAQTPDLDANAIGGTVNIVTASAFDTPDGFTRASGRVGWNEISDTTNFAVAGAVARLFGRDKQFGAVLAASFSERDYESDNYEASSTSATPLLDPFLPGQRVLRDYRIVRERTGVVANFEWRPQDGVRLYANNTYARYSDDEQRDSSTIEYAVGPIDPVTGAFSAARGTLELRDRKVIQRIYNSSLGGVFETGQLTIEGNATFARAEEDTPKRIDYEFRSPNLRLAGVADGSGLFTDITAPALADPRTYPFRRLRSRTDEVAEDVAAYTGDVRYDFADRPGYLKAGLRYVTREKSWDRTNQDFSGISSTFLLSEVAGVGDTDHLGDLFDFGPTIDRSLIRNFVAANQARFVQDVNGTLANSLVTDFTAEEDVLAGYGMGEFTIAGAVVTAGVRVERTEAEYESYDVQRRAGAITGFPLRRGGTDYTHVLPDVLVRYDVDDNLVLRAAYTNTVGRPNYTDIVPRRDFDAAETTAGSGVFRGAYSEGNPDLEPYESENLDASFEYYLRPAGVVSVGLFYKDIANPVFTRQTELANVEFEGRRYATLVTTRPENADGAELLGVEFNYQQQFDFLPAPLDGFGLSANYTLVDSETTVFGRTDPLPFFRQSDELANAALFYERGGFEGRVAVAYRSPYLEILVAPGRDVYVDERTQVDLRVSYNLSDRLQLNADLLNLTGESLRTYSGDDRRITSEERYSYSSSVGLSYRF